ncbi:MAG: hypothetical protein ABIK09_12760 [Pseudomonadota bacterium]
MKTTMWMMLVAVLSLGLAIAACDSGSGGGGDPECTPACTDKECGDDGCDGFCGTCGDTEVCQAGACIDADDPCIAACTGLECGMVDACECGSCGDDMFCGDDNMCVLGENPCIAACDGIECGLVDGCECAVCGEDKECKDNVCEDICVSVCAADGVPFECGDDGCEGSCGDCPAGDQYACDANMCVCTPDCDGKACGSDGCGGDCGDCTDGWKCSGGACYEGCDFSLVTFDHPVVKVNYLMIDGDGLEGHGMDVDNDPDTCAPAGNCENGIDNALGGILGQVEQYIDVAAELEGAMADGSIVLLFELADYMSDGSEFPMFFYLGEITGDQAACDYQTVKCDYLVDPMSYSIETCEPLISFGNATVNDGAFAAGGPDAVFSLALDVQGIALTITAVSAQIIGEVTETEGVATAIDTGLIGGAVPKALIMEAVENIPDDVELPVSKALIIGMLEMFIQADIDAGDEYGEGDPDGELESASVGIQFAAIEGAITGFKAE